MLQKARELLKGTGFLLVEAGGWYRIAQAGENFRRAGRWGRSFRRAEAEGAVRRWLAERAAAREAWDRTQAEKRRGVNR